MKILIVATALIISLGFNIWWSFRDAPVALSPTDTVSPTNTQQTTQETVKEVLQHVVPTSSLTLTLRGQNLTKVPSSTFEQTTLQSLDLSHNALTGSLPAEVRHLQNLVTLDLSYNQFTGVPAEIGQLKNLESLNLSNNQLTGLPYELGNLSHLKLLDLRGNHYSNADLALIREKLPSTTRIIVD
jgi:Leucine-rich repeat (LRR) protein